MRLNDLWGKIDKLLGKIDKFLNQIDKGTWSNSYIDKSMLKDRSFPTFHSDIWSVSGEAYSSYIELTTSQQLDKTFLDI